MHKRLVEDTAPQMELIRAGYFCLMLHSGIALSLFTLLIIDDNRYVPSVLI